MKRGCEMKPDRQSVKARLHSRMLLGLCKTGVLTIAIMATRLLRKAKTQSGTFTAARTALFMKATVSLTGKTSCASRPQMLLFVSEVIFDPLMDKRYRSFYLKRKKISCLIQNLRTDSVLVDLKKFTNVFFIMFLISFITYKMI